MRKRRKQNFTGESGLPYKIPRTHLFLIPSCDYKTKITLYRITPIMRTLTTRALLIRTFVCPRGKRGRVQNRYPRLALRFISLIVSCLLYLVYTFKNIHFIGVLLPAYQTHSRGSPQLVRVIGVLLHRYQIVYNN